MRRLFWACTKRKFLHFFSSVRDKNKTFVDIGSAEGLYSVGVLFSGFFGQVCSFEVSEESRQIQARNAETNGVTSRLRMFGKAEVSFLDLIEQTTGFCFERSVFLFDIEGAELEIITARNLERMRSATIVIETHPMFVDAVSQQQFESLLCSFHDVSVIHAGPRDPNSLPELDDWSDDDRWAICSEGRASAGRWLVLTPKSFEPE